MHQGQHAHHVEDAECAVVGGGIAGLTTALRLARHGCRVSVVEQDQVGAGSSTANHGMLHSGALFARLHPEIVRSCREAQEAFVAGFPQAVTTRWGWYLASAERLPNYQARWDSLGITHRTVNADQLSKIVHPARHVCAAAVREVLVDTHALLTDVLGRCQALGVKLIPARVERILTEHGRVRGLDLGRGAIKANQVVLCCGLGTQALLTSANSKLVPQLHSRLSLLAAYPNTGLSRPVFGLEFGGPAIVPTTDADYVLASWHGGGQPRMQQPGRWPVPLELSQQLCDELAAWFPSRVLDYQHGYAWMCSKTEHLSRRGDQWGVDPNYAVLDHQDFDQVYGLWTVLPAKMTLALHASRELAHRLLHVREPLELPAPSEVTTTRQTPLIASRPWTLYRETAS